MRTVATLAAVGVACCAIIAAPVGFAAADPSGSSSPPGPSGQSSQPSQSGQNAQQVIAQWEAQGYQVNIDRVGSAPIQDCVVTSVRNPNTNTYTVRTGGRIDNTPSTLVPVIISRTVQISLFCGS